MYLSKVSDATTADGASTGWFKIFSNSWSKKSSGRVGDDDNWGTRDLNACCGKMNVKIPSDIPSGDYLLRAEALALHTAGQAGGAQFYMTCYQISVEGGGSASPATVKFPGAYSSSDPGIRVNIHSAISNYVAPGPAVYAGGTTKIAGSGCQACESTCKVGSSPSAVAPSGKKPSDGGSSEPVEAVNSGCTVQAYGQCGYVQVLFGFVLVSLQKPPVPIQNSGLLANFRWQTEDKAILGAPAAAPGRFARQLARHITLSAAQELKEGAPREGGMF